jgi:hypothetical protein
MRRRLVMKPDAKIATRIPSVVVLVAVMILAASGCMAKPRASTSATTTIVSSTTTPAPVPLVDWHGEPLRAPINADDGALVITNGSPPPTLTRSQALALARQVLADQNWARITTQTFSGRASLSGAKAQLGPGVAQLTDQPAWIVAYQSQIAYGCPAMDGTPAVPATASHLDAVIITGVTISQVTIYHGTGTGPCIPRVYPIAVSANHP